ncbi:MAG: putative dipeptide transporter substrate-binding protein [Deltaproteobacteria bacterium]|nr:putative dipeptide transporter substrate-binding protein [Deltaproteobacteria bacterium]
MTRRLALAALVLVVVGCDAEPQDRDATYRRRDPRALVVAQATGVLGLDPLRVTDSESIEAGELLFEGLVRWKPGTTEIAPGLAASWEVSTDGKRWLFHLRPGVVFHDGTPLDALAVRFSFDRLLDPRHPNFLAGNQGAYWRSLLQAVTQIVAIDPATVEIRVSRPYAPLLGDLAMFPVVSPTAVRQWGDAFNLHPVGTGPFTFDSWIMGEQLVMKRFERYWGTAARLDRIVFRVVVDARQRLVDLESGSVDLATSILPDEQPFVELHPDLLLHHTAGNDVSYLAFNVQRPGFRDLRVRQAASHAINKLPIVKLAYQGRAIAADGPLPPTQWGYHEPKARYGFDLPRARRLLRQAIAGKTFDPDVVYKLYAPSTPRPYLDQPERVARFLQAALAEVGIQTELVLQPYREHRISLENGEHDLALHGWVGDNGDPDNFLYVLFHSDNAVVGASAQNFAFFRDAGVDKLLIEAQVAADQVTRTELYRAVQDRLVEEVPWVPIAHSEYVVAGRAEIRDVVLSPLGHPLYAKIWRRLEGGR